MNKEENRIVPQLRFPEFEKDGYWETETINDLSKTVTAGGTPSTNIEDYWGGDIRWMNSGELNLKIVEEVEGRITKEGLKNSSTKIIPENSVLIGLAGQGKTRGTVAINKVKLCTNQSIASIYPNEDVFDSEFLYHNLDNRYNELRELSAGGEGRGGLNLKIIKEIRIPIPPKKEEQQKIAACLSSLDEVITAETEKLDLYQDHKKGLLQQLFPAEGETQPKFRFPEFKEVGDWEETTLDEVADYENGKAHEKEISETGKYKVVNSKFISTEGDVVKFTDSANLMANTGDILMVLSDIPNGKAIAKCFYVDEDDTYTVNQRICKITPTDIDNRFLFYIQNRNKYFLAFDDGVKQTNLRKDTVLSFPFLKPKDPKEQEKIATCLTLADDLIKKQADKIVSLQEHKKGLLQQLFPNTNN